MCEESLAVCEERELRILELEFQVRELEEDLMAADVTITEQTEELAAYENMGISYNK